MRTRAHCVFVQAGHPLRPRPRWSRALVMTTLGFLVLVPMREALGAAPPLLQKYCRGCHGPTKQKGGLRIDKLDRDIVGGKDGERWLQVLDVLKKGEMPPAEKRQPTSAERGELVAWLGGKLEEAARSKRAQAASLLRRLTREQYTNTLGSLLGVDSDYRRLLPPESPSTMGMHNDGQVLASSTLHLEQTMKIAQLAVDRALSLEGPPPAWRFRFVFGPQKSQTAKKVDLGYQSQALKAEQYLVETFADRGPVKTATLTPNGPIRERCYVDLRGSTDHEAKGSPPRFSLDERGLLLMPAKPHVERSAQIWQGPNPNLDLVLRDFPSEGSFVLRVTVSRADAGGERPWLRAFVGNRQDDGMEYATFDQARPVDAPPGKPQVIEFRGRLENLPIPIIDPEDKAFLANMMVVGVWNDVLTSKAEVIAPALIIKSIELEGPVTSAWPSPSRHRIFFDDSQKAQPEAYARQILERFLPRAFRRPPAEGQLERYFAFWQRQFQASGRFEEAIRDTLVAVLSSPSFLHHVEEGPADEAAAVAGRRSLDDWALANRLSYFLWNTMPDDELLAVAGRGELRANLAAQAARLLDDARARAFFETFAAQWLDVGALDNVRVDVKLQPRYTRFVKEDMRLETTRFLEHLFRKNRPLGELIDANYTFLNQNLAAFYGIDGVRGSEFLPVKLPSDGRGGGLLTQGSFLVGRSTGDDSHPIKRGVWLARKILDDPPPPPPPNIPEIDREKPEIAKLSAKAQLELHRNRESCRACHRKIDPWGIPFEGFDGAGLARTTISKSVDNQAFTSPVEAAADLGDGTKIDGAGELKAYLLANRTDQIRRSVARHLAAYALGRTPGFIDEDALKDIGAQARGKTDGFRDLLFAIIESELFQSK